MKGVKVTLDTKVNKNLLDHKVDLTFGAGNVEQAGYHSFEVTGVNITPREGKKYVVSCYADAENVSLLPADKIKNHSGWGEDYAAYPESSGATESMVGPFWMPYIPWGTYKHRRLHNISIATAENMNRPPYRMFYRFDNWTSGKVRIYDVKIEESDHPTDYEE